MQDQANPTAMNALEQRQVDRSKATVATKARLVDPDETPDRRPGSRPRHV